MITPLLLVLVGWCAPPGEVALEPATVARCGEALGAGGQASDPREDYDVLAYDLDFLVLPETRRLEGRVGVRGRALVDLGQVQLDMEAGLTALAVRLGGAGETGVEQELVFEQLGDALSVELPAELVAGEDFEFSVRYRGSPRAKDSFSGFHWRETAAGEPFIGTSCQGTGSHAWWPGKASYFHPEDKPERISVDISVPAQLYGVSNGRLVETLEGDAGWPDWITREAAESPAGAAFKTYRWRHDYPLETYSVTLNVAPYVVVLDSLELPGCPAPVPFNYYVLPESAEKAAVQFAQVPELARVFSRAFGPFPFPDSKLAFVETSFWGMEHSTAIAYGSSFPAWCAAEGVADPYARRNGDFDYILVHEFAHEWWGNAVSADHWGNFWIHEGFATYAEGVYLEFTADRARADAFFARTMGRIPRSGSLYRGEAPTSGEAYSGLIYYKGAAVLHHARHCLDDDDIWWATLREFYLAQRYGNVGSAEFEALLEKNSGRPWKRFFAQWVYGEGTPRLSGSLRAAGTKLAIEITVEGEFHVPLDISWTEGGEERSARIELGPGDNILALPCEQQPREISVEHLNRIPGRHRIDY